MKRATGKTDDRPAARKVSIQQPLDGHSFSADDSLNDLPEEGVIEVEIITEQTLLVPGSLFGAEDAEALLAAAGLPVREGQCALWWDLPGVSQTTAQPASAAPQLPKLSRGPAGDTPCAECPEEAAAVVAAVDAACLRRLEERLGARLRLTTPLLQTVRPSGKCVWMRLAAGILYIKVYDGRLRLAEAVAAPAEADRRYFAQRLAREFELGEFELLLADADTRPLRREIGRLFKRTTCES